MSLADEFMKDMQAAPKDLELTELAQMAERQLFLESRVKEIEELLSNTQEELRLVAEVHIPETMAAIGMKKFTLSTGYSITIKEDVFASIRKDFIDNAVSWLDANGLGDIVKDEVKVNFGRGEMIQSEKLMNHCKNMGWNASEKMSVHPMTLKATVKEQLAKGIQFPEEFFSIGPVTKSVIKK
jgi:hypothetical protein